MVVHTIKKTPKL